MADLLVSTSRASTKRPYASITQTHRFASVLCHHFNQPQEVSVFLSLNPWRYNQFSTPRVPNSEIKLCVVKDGAPK
jgi:hypothetical protein